MRKVQGPYSASGSASTSSSAVPTFDQQHRQSLHQQYLRRPEGNDSSFLAYQSGNIHGASNFAAASASMPPPQQHGSSNIQIEQSLNSNQGVEQRMLNNPSLQAHLQYAVQASQHNSNLGMFGSFGSNDQAIPVAMAAQMQAMQAFALEHNIDLSRPENASVVAHLIPIMQSRMATQPTAGECSTASFVKESYLRGNSSSDISGQPSSSIVRQTVSPATLGANSRAALVNSSSVRVQQFSVPGIDNPMRLHGNLSRGVHSLFPAKTPTAVPEASQAQNNRQLYQSPLHAATPSNDGEACNPSTSRGESLQQMRSDVGFTKQQLHVLKVQILTFRHLKLQNGNGTLPCELLQGIAPPPLDLQLLKESEPGIQRTPIRSGVAADRGKAVVAESVQVNIPDQASNVNWPNDAGSARNYYGPLFDSPIFTRNLDTLGSSIMNNNNNLVLAYDIKDLFAEDSGEVCRRKRVEKIDKILALNLQRKNISPDLVVRLQIESRKLQLVERQARLRDEIEQQQLEIMAMPDRSYRKFVRLCERQRLELNRQARANQRAVREKQLKSVFQWRKKLLDAHWVVRDARIARNRGVHKHHERMLREFSKMKDEGRNKRMEALKSNDVERYREMLLEQQTKIPGEAAERYAVLSSFLSQTEEYLHKLGGKITAAKNQHEVEEAAYAAAAVASAQGLSEEEVRVAATCAREEVLIRNQFSEMNARKDSSSVSKYYNLAHAVNERVMTQPSSLRAGTLRDYQLVGLQWMLSLYNNKLNGILADEMGLGKTVQVMALIAHLMEFKGNYGPHLIIVPNAVLVNWKSELHNWLPNLSCIYYVGGKDQRSKMFTQEVLALKFNVLVTTYEFIMHDRSKLSRVDWKYIIIDEAQRMKDRESVLARDLDRYRCQRRLLLTGTPLQNDLKELWSLLNLLLPEVFDNRKAFHDWFSQPFQKEGATHNAEDDWLETEKKVIVIHRLHQILEPFMLRRRVEDVEGSLPPKVSIVLKCRMSAIQGAIYEWIKSTGTLRVDPEDEKKRIQKSKLYQAKSYKTLSNRCMELRKACNHPLLNYPCFSDFSKDFLVRSCGKLSILDRILVKLHRTGHKVLLFSTMTKLLDIMEEYLQWRGLEFRRIDGTTSLEDRESAIMDFNRPDTDCFVFLLSIRAAGRGLNLQSADTVIIYDPDPNPKNEEQAVARAHRIGQTREVKVIYMEAVVDKIASHQKEDEFRSGGTIDSEDGLAGKDRYMGSIESLIRNKIQQYKIDMADEVINAGRFDQRTTHEERRLTLETLLHDEERYQETLHDVPSLHEVNRMIARGEAEVQLFDQMDEEFDWTEDMVRHDQVPKWLRASTKEVNATTAALSKKPSKNSLYGESIVIESSKLASQTERKRERSRGKLPIYSELDAENGYSAQEEGDIAECEDDEFTEAPRADEDQSEEDGPVCAHVIKYQRTFRRQKFRSLSDLDGRSNARSKKLADDLEEGEIPVSGGSMMDHKTQDRDEDEDEDEQVLQPKTKGKRSIRQKSVKDVDSKVRNHVPQKESSRLGSSSSRELSQPDDARPSTHPGDLVICKKKRKYREKSAAKSGSGPAGPLSPTGQGRSIKSPGSVSGGKDVGSSQQPISRQGRAAVSPQQGNSGGGSDGWANPVRRMRTDGGRRRPRAVNNVRV